MKIFGYTLYFPHSNLRINLTKKDGWVANLGVVDRIKYMIKRRVICFPLWSSVDIWADKVLTGRIRG